MNLNLKQINESEGWLAASFQAAVSDTLLIKTREAMKQTGLKELVIGGVASQCIRNALITALRVTRFIFLRQSLHR